MQKFDFLVIESDETRVESVLSALHFLGYRPQHGAACRETDESTHAWRAVYIGSVDDPDLPRDFARHYEKYMKDAVKRIGRRR